MHRESQRQTNHRTVVEDLTAIHPNCPQMPRSEARNRLNADAILLILSLLPTKSVLRFKAVCRAWQALISGSSFARFHSKSAQPFAGLFFKSLFSVTNSQRCIPINTNSDNIPDVIPRLFNHPFKLLASNNGLVCLLRQTRPGLYDDVLYLGNPVTSQWTAVTDLVRYRLNRRLHGAVIVCNPAETPHYKLVYVSIGHTDNNYHCYRIFHVFSSETRSWKESSAFEFRSKGGSSLEWSKNRYILASTGGGAVCWLHELDCMAGYEIATDSCWTAALPSVCSKGSWRSTAVVGHGGLVHLLAIFGCKILLWRLEGREMWVVEGEACNEELETFYPVPLAYDPVRRVVFIGGKPTDELVACHLPTSTWEVIHQEDGFRFVTWVFPHANTLAAVHIEGANAIERFLND